jgi:hypothetical protein
MSAFNREAIFALIAMATHIENAQPNPTTNQDTVEPIYKNVLQTGNLITMIEAFL